MQTTKTSIIKASGRTRSPGLVVVQPWPTSLQRAMNMKSCRGEKKQTSKTRRNEQLLRQRRERYKKNGGSFWEQIKRYRLFWGFSSFGLDLNYSSPGFVENKILLFHFQVKWNISQVGILANQFVTFNLVSLGHRFFCTLMSLMSPRQKRGCFQRRTSPSADF